MRALIYKQIDGRRDKQDTKYGGPEHDDGHVPNDWIALITRYAGEAAAYPACSKSLTQGDEVRFRARMLDVAAIAVAAIEQIDRRREANPHTCDGTLTEGSRVTDQGACWYCGDQVVG